MKDTGILINFKCYSDSSFISLKFALIYLFIVWLIDWLIEFGIYTTVYIVKPIIFFHFYKDPSVATQVVQCSKGLYPLSHLTGPLGYWIDWMLDRKNFDNLYFL